MMIFSISIDYKISIYVSYDNLHVLVWKYMEYILKYLLLNNKFDVKNYNKI